MASLATLMSTEALAPQALLHLMWLASPALPIGGFSYSEGLESAIDQGIVHDEDSCGQWLVSQLHLSQSRGDMAVIAQAIPAWRAFDADRLQALSQWVWSTRESAELRLQAEQMGRSLLEWMRQLKEVDPARLQLLAELPASLPLAFALALSRIDAPTAMGLHSYGFSWAENMVQAALKAVPLGQSSGQRILRRLTRAMDDAVQHALRLSDAQRQAFSPMLAILSSRHEHQYSRLFRS